MKSLHLTNAIKTLTQVMTDLLPSDLNQCWVIVASNITLFMSNSKWWPLSEILHNTKVTLEHSGHTVTYNGYIDIHNHNAYSLISASHSHKYHIFSVEQCSQQCLFSKVQWQHDLIQYAACYKLTKLETWVSEVWIGFWSMKATLAYS